MYKLLKSTTYIDPIANKTLYFKNEETFYDCMHSALDAMDAQYLEDLSEKGALFTRCYLGHYCAFYVKLKDVLLACDYTVTS